MSTSFRLSIAAAMLAVATLPALSLSALADDWKAVKLRGTVQQMVAGQWTSLSLGDVVPDDRQIRTLSDGHVAFQRDQDMVSLETDTQIVIKDQAGGKRFTTILQDFGTVDAEVEVENVQHFSVETPYLAAVVKGTHFIVRSTNVGTSVMVERGLVAVEAKSDHASTTIGKGQTATIGVTTSLTVSGEGKLPPILMAEAEAPVAAPSAAQPAPEAVVTAPVAAPETTVAAETQVKLVPAPAADTPWSWVALKSGEYGWLIGLAGIGIGIVVGGVLLAFRRIFG